MSRSEAARAWVTQPPMLNRRNTGIAKPNLFTRKGALRLSLLVSLGLLPGACGGSSSDPSQPGGTAGGAGAPSQPGAAGSNAGVSGSNAGVGGSSAGAGNAGSSNAGAPAQGGAAGHTSAGAPGQGGSPGCASPHVDPMTGLTVCSSGVQHRPSPVACTYSGTGGSGGSGGASQPTAGAGGQGIVCATDKDCAGIKYGYCEYRFGRGTCQSGCVQDSDCQAKQFCLCSGPGLGGTCVDTHCSVDADCGSGSLCAVTGNGCAPTTLACTDPADECTLDKDCKKIGDRCVVLLDSHRVCTLIACSSGATQ